MCEQKKAMLERYSLATQSDDELILTADFMHVSYKFMPLNSVRCHETCTAKPIKSGGEFRTAGSHF